MPRALQPTAWTGCCLRCAAAAGRPASSMPITVHPNVCSCLHARGAPAGAAKLQSRRCSVRGSRLLGVAGTSRPRLAPLLSLCKAASAPGVTALPLLQVRDGIVPLLAAVKKGRAPDRAWLAGSYDRSKQTELFQQVAVDLGERRRRPYHCLFVWLVGCCSRRLPFAAF